MKENSQAMVEWNSILPSWPNLWVMLSATWKRNAQASSALNNGTARYQMNGFLKHFSKWDKDTFVFGAVFLLVMVGLMRVKADPIYFIGAGCAFIVLYVCMRYALLRAQEMEREANFKRLPQRKARQIVDANATKSEKQALDKFRDSVKTRRK